MSVNLISNQSLYIALSSDVKPTDVNIGSRLLETDTNLKYIFDGSNWILYVGGAFIEY